MIDRALTWEMLLARWTEFAQSAVALPTQGDAGRWREAVPDIIALQALTHALAEVGELPNDERAAALDRAAISINAHTTHTHALWQGQTLPTHLIELIEDASLALQAANASGLEWIVTSEEWIAPDWTPLIRALSNHELTNVLSIATPGSILFTNEPAVFAANTQGQLPSLQVIEAISAWSGLSPRPAPIQRQIYRVISPEGKAERDIVAPIDADLPAGRPLLNPIIANGVMVQFSTPVLADTESWIALQRVAIHDTLPIEYR